MRACGKGAGCISGREVRKGGLNESVFACCLGDLRTFPDPLTSRSARLGSTRAILRASVQQAMAVSASNGKLAPPTTHGVAIDTSNSTLLTPFAIAAARATR